MKTCVTWASSAASSSLRSTSTVSTNFAAGTQKSSSRWRTRGSHGVGVKVPAVTVAVRLKVILLCVCSWRLPAAGVGLQCWSWPTPVAATTWGRLCWGNFVPCSTQSRSVCGSTSHQLCSIRRRTLKWSVLLLFSAGVRPVRTDSCQSPAALHTTAPWQCQGAGVWR